MWLGVWIIKNFYLVEEGFCDLLGKFWIIGIGKGFGLLGFFNLFGS